MADFTGFYFNNKHSSTYHLLRVSNGDRYEEELFPQFDDRIVELVGGAGNLYDSTRYKEKEFTISVVFDSLTEKDFRDIRQWLEPNKVQEFRFDERPYKAYWAKLKSPPKFDYVCFMKTGDEGFNAKQERVYKGEAELNFIAYNPFGYCNDDSTKMTESGLSENEDGINWQALDSYSHVNGIHEDNLVEWAAESGLMNKTEIKKYNQFELDKNTNTLAANLYNPGDFDADFELYITPNLVDIPNEGVTIEIYIDEEIGNKGKYFLSFSANELKDTTSISNHMLINTKNHSLKKIVVTETIEGGEKKLDIKAQLRYDLIKNKTIEWLKIPKGKSQIRIVFSKLDNVPIAKIKYGYKYY